MKSLKCNYVIPQTSLTSCVLFALVSKILNLFFKAKEKIFTEEMFMPEFSPVLFCTQDVTRYKKFINSWRISFIISTRNIFVVWAIRIVHILIIFYVARFNVLTCDEILYTFLRQFIYLPLCHLLLFFLFVSY